MNRQSSTHPFICATQAGRLILFLCVFLFETGFFLISCRPAEDPGTATTNLSPEPALIVTATATPALTPSPTPTNTSKPTATSPPSATPLPTATLNQIHLALSATPGPTDTPCPRPVVPASISTAIDDLSLLANYRVYLRLVLPAQYDEPILLVEINHVAEQGITEIMTTQQVSSIVGQQDVSLHQFIVNDYRYDRIDDEPWEAFRGPEVKEGVLAFNLLRIFADLVQGPLSEPEPECYPKYNYRFEGVNIAGNDWLMMLAEDIGAAENDTQLSVRLHPNEGLKEVYLFLEPPDFDDALYLSLTVAPEGVAPTTLELPSDLPEADFGLVVPVPEQAEIAIEGVDILVQHVPDNMATIQRWYQEALRTTGWLVQESSTDREEGWVRLTYQRDDDEILLSLKEESDHTEIVYLILAP